MTKSYDQMLYRELLTLARQRSLPLRGGKAALVRRLTAADAGKTAKPERPNRPDREVRTGKGTTFVICGEHEVWNRRCGCEDPEDERADGDEEADKQNKTSTST